MRKKFLLILSAVITFCGLITFSFSVNALPRDSLRCLRLEVYKFTDNSDDYYIPVDHRRLNSFLDYQGFSDMCSVPEDAAQTNWGICIHRHFQDMHPFFYRACEEAGLTDSEYINTDIPLVRKYFVYLRDNVSSLPGVRLTRSGLDKIVPVLKNRYNIALWMWNSLGGRVDL